MTAVRRHDVSKSAMTKVMDLFRHRSNSAVSEADKRKAVSTMEGLWGNCVEAKSDIGRLGEGGGFIGVMLLLVI